MLQVVAGVIQRDGRVLVCRRTELQSHPLQWEFPGGKVEPGETPRDALERELEEELGIAGAQGSEIARYEFEYPGKPRVNLIFFSVESFEGEPGNRIFHEMRWETPDNLADYDFVEGDIEFLNRHAPWRRAL
jgi:8-oxo-dGTP diphosphatase